ncbi:hypothetical protein L3Y34_012829 [Caenorhabditis briggsae]|uniref:Uncharacterized protein n=1 Tax=Caenorhabditis briggsae TaxID=6238 RepID=A0AAE8ZWU2_CAEBR|nr:hypothetical protein L3Y34_012829 [Caenorhabditis briggsae]
MTSNIPQAVPLDPTQRVNYLHTSFNPMQNLFQSDGRFFSQHLPTLPGSEEEFIECNNPNCLMNAQNLQGVYGSPAQTRYNSSDPNYHHQAENNHFPLDHGLVVPALQYEQEYQNQNNKVPIVTSSQPLAHYPHPQNQPVVQYTPTMVAQAQQVPPAPPMRTMGNNELQMIYHSPENMQSQMGSHPFPNEYHSVNVPEYPSTGYWHNDQMGRTVPAPHQMNSTCNQQTHWQRTTYFHNSHSAQSMPYQQPMPMYQPETQGLQTIYGYPQNENAHGTMISNQGYRPISNPNNNWQHTVYYDGPANNAQYTVASTPQQTNIIVESSSIMDPEKAGISGSSQEEAYGKGSSQTEANVQTEDCEYHAAVPEVDEKAEQLNTTISQNEELETDQPSQDRNLTSSETTTTYHGTFKVPEKNEITGDESKESRSIENLKSNLQSEAQCETGPFQISEQGPYSAKLKFTNEAEKFDQKSSVLNDQQQSTYAIVSSGISGTQLTSQIISRTDNNLGAANTELKHAVSYLSEEVKRLNVYCENIICGEKLNEGVAKTDFSQQVSNEKVMDNSIDLRENQIEITQSSMNSNSPMVERYPDTTYPNRLYTESAYQKNFPTLGETGPRTKECPKTLYDFSSNSGKSSKTYADVLGLTHFSEPKRESPNTSSTEAIPSTNIGNQNQSPHISRNFRSNNYQRSGSSRSENSGNNRYRSNYNGWRNQNSSQANNRNQFRKSYNSPANEKTEGQLETLLAKTELILSSVKDLQENSNKPIQIPSVNIALNNNYTDGFCKLEKSVENSGRIPVKLETMSKVDVIENDDSNKIKSENDSWASDTDTVATEQSTISVKKQKALKARKSKSKKKGCKTQKSSRIKAGTNTTASFELDETDSDDIAKARHVERTFDHLISYALDDYYQTFRPVRSTYLAFQKELPSLHPLQIEIIEFWKTRTPGTLPFMETLKTLKRELTARINAYNSGDMETWKMKRFLETVKEELLSDYGETVVLQDLSFLFHKYLSDYNRNVLYKRYMEMVITFPMWKPVVDPEFSVKTLAFLMVIFSMYIEK